VREQVAKFCIQGPKPPTIDDLPEFTLWLRAILRTASAEASIFSGRSIYGPLRGHRHAFIFVETEPRKRNISNLVIYATDGFRDGERGVLESLDTKTCKEFNVELRLHSFGTVMSYSDSGLFGPSKIWESLTPFVSPFRMDKFDLRSSWRGRDSTSRFLLTALYKLLKLRGLEGVSRVELVGKLSGADLFFDRLHRVRVSYGYAADCESLGAFFRLHFASPVSGPIALGFGSHIGLGVFTKSEIPSTVLRC
jgi:CRISPR-associated protein Csb2